MKILAIAFKNPFGEYYSNPIELDSLENINIIIGKNNSGKTTILETIIRVLHNDFNQNHEILRYKVEMDGLEFQDNIHNFFEKFYGSNVSKSRSIPRVLDSHRKDDFQELTMRILELIHKFNSIKACIFDIDFNRNKDIDTLLFDLKIKNKENLLAEYDDKYLKEFIERISDFNRNLNYKSEFSSEFTISIFNSMLPKGRFLQIPSLRSLGTSSVKYGPEDITESREIFERIIQGNIRALSKNGVFNIPNLAIILNRIAQGRFSEIDRSQVDNFLQDLNEIFPEINLNIDQPDEFRLSIKVEEYGRIIDDWKELGNGTQQLISLLFLFRFPGNFIYIIDEPENGLHPGLQTKLLQYIKNKILTETKYSKQFFFATHSTSFIDFKGECSIYSCLKNEDTFNLKKSSNDTFEEFRDLLGITPGYALQKNGIVWVEGPSDSIYLKAFLKCFDIDTEREDIIILPYNGRSYLEKEYISLELIKAINPNFSILVDSDYEKPNKSLNKQLEKIKNKFEEENYTFFVVDKVRDIEGLIPQELLNKHFKITTPLTKENLKNPFEKLEDYVVRIKKSGLTKPNAPKFDKIRTAKSIKKILEEDNSMDHYIANDPYIREIKDILADNFRKWIVNPVSKYFKYVKDSKNKKKSDFKLFERSIYANYSVEDLFNEYQNIGLDSDALGIIYQGLKKYGNKAIDVLLNEFYMGYDDSSLTAEELLNELEPEWREKFPLDKGIDTNFFDTPPRTADYMVTKLGKIKPTDRILDPCVGNGAFVKSLLNSGVDRNQIYTIDIEPKFKSLIEGMGVSFRVQDTLLDLGPNDYEEFDFILLDPPLLTENSEYFQINKSTFIKLYDKINSYNTYAMFIVNSLWRLKNGGKLAIISSDIILNMRIHEGLRTFILNNCKIEEILLAPLNLFEKQNIRIESVILILKRISGIENKKNREENVIRFVPRVKNEFDYLNPNMLKEIIQHRFRRNEFNNFLLPSNEFDDPYGVKRKLIEMIRNYIKFKHDDQKEREIIGSMGLLLDDEKLNFQKVGFDYLNKDTIRDNKFQIHLKRPGENEIIRQFLIRKLDLEYKTFNPDQVYFSERYSKEQKLNNEISVIIDFIDHLMLK